ncbi:hypothetical protein GCM10028806_03950 [Spirosoma terrae]|uniref:Uncharacterized protein n=1 Tax=Spirosoma terrae TaxID=1968276 RepID=A0A6L9LCU0_9BACT|nr:hypothetical protein [Spirosoma terrae]NDU98364.1 hypothetical protein [Spirosoma terrae]
MNTSSEELAKIYGFLAEIGISVTEMPLTGSSFLPGILIDKGGLLIDSGKLLYPGDVLHEAGHIAVTLPSERSELMNDVTAGKPEKQGDEIAVILWTYAACVHIGLPVDVVFHAGGYKGDNNWIIQQFDSKNYIGLPLLVWMGMCDADSFPAMRTWLRNEPQPVAT